MASSYLADELNYPTVSEFRRRLRSASYHELSVPRTRLSSLNLQRPSFFSVAAVHAVSIPQHITLGTKCPQKVQRLNLRVVDGFVPEAET